MGSEGWNVHRPRGVGRSVAVEVAGTIVTVLFEVGFVWAKLAGWTTWSWWVVLVAPFLIGVLIAVLLAFVSGCGGAMLVMATGFMHTGKLLGDLSVSWWVVLSPLFLLGALVVLAGLLESVPHEPSQARTDGSPACQNCGASNGSAAKFCGACGAPLA